MQVDHDHKLKNLLKEKFGYSDFREGQREIIDAILAKKNVLAVMPTGAGKSLCYQLPAIHVTQKTVIISPLVALMDDQVAGLAGRGVPVSKIHSGQSRDANVVQWRRFAGDQTNILYLSPERLMQPRMIETLQRFSIASFVVDEAHCISKWGAGFRPDYEELSNLQGLFPDAVISAFTATADSATRADIVGKLTGGNCTVFVKGFDRPNLSLRVLPKQDHKKNLLAFLDERRQQSGIVYCLSRNETDKTAIFLAENGFKAIAYHAGKSPDYRRDAQDRFMTEEAVIMVATIAFGMGIDKPDIRFVVHASMPSSMEAFYQEIGRAGRDGAAAETLMFYGLQDLVKRQQMIFNGEGSEAHKRREYKRLDALIGYCETIACRRIALLSYFDETAVKCGNCDNCLSPPEVEDCSDVAKFIITAIKETGQYFGVTHIIDVVRGDKTAKVKARAHDMLGVFGAGAQHSKQVLQAIIRQLIATAALNVNLEKYGALEVAESGNNIFLGREKFMAKTVSDALLTASKQTRTAKASAMAVAAMPQRNPDLLAALKQLRLHLAKERSVPAYVIFADKTLFQMANDTPITEDEFLAINGVGRAKLAEFYHPFHDLISEFNASADG